jgi:hypothetical protein
MDAVVQLSSHLAGMGKSRLLDELSKNFFTIIVLVLRASESLSPSSGSELAQGGLPKGQTDRLTRTLFAMGQSYTSE